MSQSDPLVHALHQQARAIQPELPDGLHRTVMESLAAIPHPAATPLLHRLRWLFACTGAAVLLVAAALLLLRQPASHPTNPTPPIAHKPVNPQSDLFATANWPMLAETLVEDPLEREWQQLLTDLSEAHRTLTRPLPASRKAGAEPRTQTNAPAGA